ESSPQRQRPRGRRQQRHRRGRRLPVFPARRRAHGMAREVAEDRGPARMPARCPILPCRGRWPAPRAPRLALRGALAEDEAGHRPVRLLGRRRGALRRARQRSQPGGRMILGMSVGTFTVLHVVLSLVGILAGIIVVVGMLRGSRLGGWTALFLA